MCACNGMRAGDRLCRSSAGPREPGRRTSERGRQQRTMAACQLTERGLSVVSCRGDALAQAGRVETGEVVGAVERHWSGSGVALAWLWSGAGVALQSLSVPGQRSAGGASASRQHGPRWPVAPASSAANAAWPDCSFRFRFHFHLDRILTSPTPPASTSPTQPTSPAPPAPAAGLNSEHATRARPPSPRPAAAMTPASPDPDALSIAAMLDHQEPDPAPDRPAAMPAAAAPPPKPATAPLRQQPPPGTRSHNLSGHSSSAASPLSSRDASPARSLPRAATPSNSVTRSGFRSRKSSADSSAQSKTPSAAAIKRALSASNVPELPTAATSDMAKAPPPLKSSSASNSGDNTPRWPISPRLRSPPPGDNSRSRSRTNSLRSQIRKPDVPSTPAIIVQSSSPAPLSRFPVREEPVSSDPDEPVLSMKTPARAASGAPSKLETVQESSLPATPGFETQRSVFFVLLCCRCALFADCCPASYPLPLHTEVLMKTQMTSAHSRFLKI